jgi:predicted TIM-barrel fold metal-dependent hydrolase
MMIVDAQAHIWDAHSPARPWPPAGTHTAHRLEPVGVAETLRVLDGAGVRRAVLVPPSWEGDRNDLALDAAARYPHRFAVMGRFPLSDPSAHARLRAWRDQPNMLGVRVTLHRDPWRAAFRRDELDWFWAAASDAGLPVMVYAPGLSDRLAVVARRYPQLRLIVDHLALPVGLTGPEAFGGLPELLSLARFPHVAAKASALPCHSRREFPFTDIHWPLRQVFEEFGPSRLFWGSDWTRLPCSYRENMALFTDELPFLSGADVRAVMGEALLDWLDWPVPEIATGPRIDATATRPD